MERIKIKWRELVAPAVGAAISVLVGLLSAFLTRKNMDLESYATLPPLAPPMWLFPVVWTILYILMGVGAGFIYNRRETDEGAVRSALMTFLFQLFINFIWSIVFFNLKSVLLALVLLAVLIAAVVRMTVQFWRIDPLAGKLQIPYIVWLAVAFYLNLAILILNGTQL